MKSLTISLILALICSLTCLTLATEHIAFETTQEPFEGALFVNFRLKNSSKESTDASALLLIKATACCSATPKIDISSNAAYVAVGCPLTAQKLANESCTKKDPWVELAGDNVEMIALKVDKSFNAEQCMDMGAYNCSNGKCKSVLCNNSVGQKLFFVAVLAIFATIFF
jgi:hypothetical protein